MAQANRDDPKSKQQQHNYGPGGFQQPSSAYKPEEPLTSKTGSAVAYGSGGAASHATPPQYGSANVLGGTVASSNAWHGASYQSAGSLAAAPKSPLIAISSSPRAAPGSSAAPSPITSIIATPSAAAAASISSKPRTVVVDKSIVATTTLNNTGAPPISSQGSTPSHNNNTALTGHNAASSAAVKETPEILEGLKAGQKYEGIPNKITGFISKQRNRGKGWHKRYYVLEKGFLTYSKNKQEWDRTKYHGVIDVGLSIITVNRNTSKIHIDTGESLYYFRVTKDEFDSWVQCLREHRLYRQNEVSSNFTPKQQQHIARHSLAQQNNNAANDADDAVEVNSNDSPVSVFGGAAAGKNAAAPLPVVRLIATQSLTAKPVSAASARPPSVHSGTIASRAGWQLEQPVSITTYDAAQQQNASMIMNAMHVVERNAGAFDAIGQQVTLSQDLLARLSAILEQMEMEQSAEPDFDELCGRDSAQPRTTDPASSSAAATTTAGAGGTSKGLLHLFGRRANKKKKSISADQKTLAEVIASTAPQSTTSQPPSAITSHAVSTPLHSSVPISTIPENSNTNSSTLRAAHHHPVSNLSPNVAGVVSSVPAHVAVALTAATLGAAGANRHPSGGGSGGSSSGVSPMLLQSSSASNLPALGGAGTHQHSLQTSASFRSNLAHSSNSESSSVVPGLSLAAATPSPSNAGTTNANLLPHLNILQQQQDHSGSTKSPLAGGSSGGAGGYSVPPSPAPSDVSQFNHHHSMTHNCEIYRHYLTIAQMLLRTFTETQGLCKAQQNVLKQQAFLLSNSGGASGGAGGGVSNLDVAGAINTLPAGVLGASGRTSMSRIVGQLVRQNRELRSRLYSRLDGSTTDAGTLRDTLRADKFPHELLAQSLSAGSTGSADLFFDAIEGFDEDIMSENDSDSESEKSSADRESIDSETESDAEPTATNRTTPSHVTDQNQQHVAAGGVHAADTTLGSARGPLAVAVGGVTPFAAEMSLKPAAEESLTMFHARRTKLPSPRQDAGVSLWSVLRKAIGKDLSKISLPVSLNEPLGVLQRLCEELEYCDLLERAAEHADPLDRIMYVAAFSVSGFASGNYRSGSKPFNPLLGETYECIREDKGFRFVGEQVSHHPPISACHATSKHYSFWQDCRVKTKFWGRSMEVSASGLVSCELTKYHETYTWTKPSSTVLNIFSAKRSIELNGEIPLECSSGYKCRLQYTKGGSGSGHEVVGEITNPDGRLVRYVYGKWNEGLYFSEPLANAAKAKTTTFASNPATAKELWRPGVMPEDHELYYGFSQFAIELNELQDGMEKTLPITDTRFRPDQRLLECGHLESAEEEKNRLEAAQRDRRTEMEAEGLHWEPKWFRKVSESQDLWEFNSQYWKTRDNPGFRRVNLPVLW